MQRIQTICLGHKEKFSTTFKSISELEAQVLEKYRKYLVKPDEKEIRVPFVLIYKNKTTKKEEILTDINIIPRNDKQWFLLYVKRIWDACCVCISPFGVTSDQLPCECQAEDCGYQYCVICVQSIKACNKQNNGQFYCLYCQKSYVEDAKVNDILLDLLWQKYAVKYGSELLSSINFMPGALSNDISSRIIHVQSLIQTLNGKIDHEVSLSDSIQGVLGRGGTFIKNLRMLKRDVDMMISANTDDNLQHYFAIYLNELNGNNERARRCENFVEICELLLYHIKQIELKKHFPSLHEQINKWENTMLTSDQFQPKTIDVFKSLEHDLGHNIIPSIPCRVGVIGETNAGKTSLLLNLRQITDDYRTNFQLKDLPDVILSSPIGVHKSTYCQLEFEHTYENSTKVIFVDIQGSTDNDLQIKSGNYFDQIRQADCDLYILVVEHSLTDVHRNWLQYITNGMKRTCWIVRSKVDELFIRTFEQDVGQDFYSSNEIIKNKYAQNVVQRIRKLATTDNNGNELSNIYLVYASNESDKNNKNLSILPYATFDLKKLINDIKELPVSFHENRLQQISIHAVSRVINICFRRGYALNTIKYNVLTGFAAVVPFLELVPRYFARDRIRQNIGVNTHWNFTKRLTGEIDEFQDYLRELNIEIDESHLKTSAFKNSLVSRNTSRSEEVKHASSVVVKTATSVAAAGATLSDDGLRAVGVGAVNTVRGISVVFAIAGGVLTAGMCAWSAVSNGKQMYDYLNRLCDDLIYISGHTAMQIIHSNHEIRNHFLN